MLLEEELPHAQGQGQRPRVPACDGAGTAERSYPASEVGGEGGGGQEELPRVRGRGDSREELPHAPTPKAKGGGQEEQPHVQGAVAARTQEGLEELSHIEGQEGRQ